MALDMLNFDREFIKNTVEILQKATLSKPVNNSKFIKIKITKIIYQDANSRHNQNYNLSFTSVPEYSVKKMFYIEQFTKKQAFQQTLSCNELVEFFMNHIPSSFKNAYFECINGKDCFFYNILTNKKGKISVLKKMSCKIEKKEYICANDNSITPNIFYSANNLNRQKQYIIREGIPVPFLIKLGVMNQEGKVINKKYDKFKQINRFLEYIKDILPEIQNTQNKPIYIVDFGCGKSYLTFAVYHYLNKILNLPVEIVGLDLKEDVILMCSRLAKEFEYDNLHFYCNSIEKYFENNNRPTDLVISLHACDTATDYAIASAIKQEAKAILSVPCCQHELNLKIGKKLEKSSTDKIAYERQISAIETFFKYGIARERFLALATDVMRCELLEKTGYSTQLLEFIDMTHTPKNLLIRAVKKNKKFNKSNEKNITDGYNAIADVLGTNIVLAKILGINN
ncbi:MAG: class I SAM-dependent methyltransferase [Treponemataceae bacterium]